MTPNDITREIEAMVCRAKFVAQLEERNACAGLLEKTADVYEECPSDRIGKVLRKAAKAIRERPIHA